MWRQGCGWMLLGAVTALALPAWAQFDAQGYGNLVWDTDRHCWVRVDRQSFTRRLVEEGAGQTRSAGDLSRTPLRLDAKPQTLSIQRGQVHTGDAPPRSLSEFEAAVSAERVPTTGPDGKPLAPGARAFIADLFAPGGYGDVGGGGAYGDVTGSDPDRPDPGSFVASIHLTGYGTFYLDRDGNAGHLPPAFDDGGSRLPHTSTTSYTGIGTATYYSYPGSPDAPPTGLSDVTYHVDPSTDRVTGITFTFADRSPLHLSPTSGIGLLGDPSTPGPLHLQRYNPGAGQVAWVEPARKTTPAAKDAQEPTTAQPTPAPAGTSTGAADMEIDRSLLTAKYEPDFGFGSAWHRRLLEDRDFDGDPVARDADRGHVFQPGIQVSFLGPPPLSDAERLEINSAADQVTAMGEQIAQRRRNAARQLELINGQQEIFDLFHARAVGSLDQAREQAKGVILGQLKAGLGVLLKNSDAIKDSIDKMPDGPAKQQLSKLVNNDNWDAFLAGGTESVATGMFESVNFVNDLVNGGIGEAALNFLPDNVQLAIGQIRAAHQLSQAIPGLVEGAWNTQELEDLGEQIGLNRQHLVAYLRETRQLVAQQELLAGQLVDATTAAVRGVNGLERARFINGVIQELENNAGGVDVSAQLNTLRALRDETVVYLPGGEWGVEPVLYERLWLVPNAGARYRMLIEQEMRERYGPDWSWIGSRPDVPGLGIMEPPAGTANTARVEPVKPGTPTPKPKDDAAPAGVIPVTLPNGSTASVPDTGVGPITMPDGSRIYNYANHPTVERVIVLAGGATVTHLRNGQVQVDQPDGTSTLRNPDGAIRVTLPNGQVVYRQPGRPTVVQAERFRVVVAPDAPQLLAPNMLGGSDSFTVTDTQASTVLTQLNYDAPAALQR